MGTRRAASETAPASAASVPAPRRAVRRTGSPAAGAAAGAAGKLREYRAKRDFHSTPEPAPAAEPAAGTPARASKRPARSRSRAAASPQSAPARFVVHEHHARRLHWDLRLEHDGTLLSWAVPNGIPQDPRENRKAIHVEDHPLSYIDFEGEIPRGSYGAGRVCIWDSGSYDCEKLEDGKVVVVFHGRRLRGRYALFRTGGERDWMIHRMDSPDPARVTMPEHLLPMLASPGELPRHEAEWAFELKWDGVRAIAYVQPGRLRVESRNLNDIGARYPELRALGRQLGMREAVLDGEIVAFDEHGAPSFERLQGRMHLTSESTIRRFARDAPVTYVIFDLLHLDGRSTVELPYRERRALLEQLELNGPAWQTPAYHTGNGRGLLAATAERRLEGLLAKQLESPYRPGERSRQWLKIKNTARQELVIGGWLPGKGRRTGQLGALLMGYYEKDGRRRVLRYAGRVGTGFDEAELERLGAALDSRKRRSSPFAERGVQPPREARFVKPELLAEIEFSHWTQERILRHSVYRGLRADKPAREVELELETRASSSPASGSSSSASRRSPARRTPTAASPVGQPRQALAREAPDEQAQPYRVTHQTKRHTEIQAQGRTLRLSNREKVLYPQTGFTKGQLVDYYAAVAPVLLPHLAGRPLTLKRYPDGVQGEYFYEKRCPAHRPDWVQTAAIPSERQGEAIDYCLAEDLPTLIWLANLADIELHTSLSRARDMDTPTALVFDLDPGAPAALKECCRVALLIGELLEELQLQTLVKTSGSKGLQLYLPLNTPVSYEQTKPFARAVAQLLEKRHPELVTSRMTKSLRPGKVLIDWSQNDPHKTTVCVYSLRALQHPLISTPLRWEEVQRAARRRRESPLSLEPAELLARVEREGDLHAGLVTLTQELPDLGADREARFYGESSRGREARKRTPKRSDGGEPMPPSGVKKGSKRARQYEHIKDSERKRGVSEGRAEEIAARTVNKERARSGEARSSSRTSTNDISSARRGGLRSGKPGPRGRTREQLYQEARKLGVPGRSDMNKAELQRAVDSRKRP
jgi:bifunctional non-homologous end joining protein LigD